MIESDCAEHIDVAGATPAVSVIIPVYKVEAYIRESIECLVHQTLQNIELIFIDDKGGDGSMDIVREYAARDPRIVILDNLVNKGTGASRNRGIEYAHGKYIAFFDPDDLCDTDFYEKLYREAERTGASIVKGGCIEFRADGKEHRSTLNDRIRQWLGRGGDLYNGFRYEHWSAIYRRDWVMECGARNGSSKAGQDTTFLVQVCMGQQGSFVINDKVCYRYRHREGSATKSKAVFCFAQLHGKREKIEILNQRAKVDSNYFAFCAAALDFSAHDYLPDVFPDKAQDSRFDEYIQALIDFTMMVRDFPSMCEWVTRDESRAIITLAIKIQNGTSVEHPGSAFMNELMRLATSQHLRIQKLKKLKKKWWKRLFSAPKLPEAPQTEGKTQAATAPYPIISIIVPVYRVENYIERCLACLLRQTMKELEFIFIDDCGGDGSMEIIERYALQDPRIVILHNETNSGAGYSRNRGIDMAKGRYIAFFDPDDSCDSNFYERLYAQACQSKALISKGACALVFPNGRTAVSSLNKRMRRDLNKKFELFTAFTSEHWTAIYRRDWVLERKARYGKFSQGEDTFFQLQVCCGVGKRIAVCDDVRYYYHQREDSVSHVHDIGFFRDQVASKQEKLDFLNQAGLSGKSYERYCATMLDFLAHHYISDMFDSQELMGELDNYVQSVLELAKQMKGLKNIRKYATCPGCRVIIDMALSGYKSAHYGRNYLNRLCNGLERNRNKETSLRKKLGVSIIGRWYNKLLHR